jgi:hypothetical protein
VTTPTPRNTHWFHRHPVIALGAIVVAGIVVALAAAELAARVLMPQWAPVTAERVVFWRYDATLGWAHRPGQSGRFIHPDFDVDVRINAHGLRDDDTLIERTGKHRMLVLGDSFGWGFGVEQSDRFSEVIERANPDWEVVNASVSGYGTDQELLYLESDGLAYHPDVVLVLFHENDLENNSRAEEYWYAKPFFTLSSDTLALHNVPVPESTFKQRCNRFFYGRTYLLGRLYAGLGQLTREARRPFWSRSTVSSEPGEGEAVTRAIIARMNDVCRDGGARLVVVSVPSPNEPARWLDGVCASLDVPHLSLASAFDAAGGDLTFPHDGHWTGDGHAAAARAIASFLAASGVADLKSTH